MSQPPVVIEPYNPEWPTMFENERTLLEPILKEWLVAPLEHIGSTSVPGLAAKPIIDILGGVGSLAASQGAIEAAAPVGYCYYPYKPDQMHWFCKPSDQVRTHHLHLVSFGSSVWNARLAFRNRLREDEVLRQAYQDLKLDLAKRFRQDREAYTEAKTQFILNALGG